MSVHKKERDMKLELQGIKKSFDGTEILHGINFSVEGGSALGLLGRNVPRYILKV